jgi:hypothetical protein
MHSCRKCYKDMGFDAERYVTILKQQKAMKGDVKQYEARPKDALRNKAILKDAKRVIVRQSETK